MLWPTAPPADHVIDNNNSNDVNAINNNDAADNDNAANDDNAADANNVSNVDNPRQRGPKRKRTRKRVESPNPRRGFRTKRPCPIRASRRNQVQTGEYVEQSRFKFKSIPALNSYFKHASLVADDTRVIVCRRCDWRTTAYHLPRLSLHQAQCSHRLDSDELNETNQEDNIPSDRKSFNYKRARIMVKHGLPLRLLSCKLFKKFFKEYAPQIKLASRERMSNYYIANLAKKTNKQFNQLVKSSRDYSISVEFDHWTDRCHRSILGVVATLPSGQKHLVSIEDVSLLDHTADSVVHSLKRALADIPPVKINAIVSDCASNGLSAKKKLLEDPSFTHLIAHKCGAHWLNLIGSDIYNSTFVTDMIDECNNLAYCFTNDSHVSALLKQAGERSVRRGVPTRWYTTATMLECLLDVRESAIKAVEESLATTRPNEATLKERCMALLKDDDLFFHISKVVKVVRPLVNCIAIAEEKDGTLPRLMVSILKFARDLMAMDWNDEFVMASIEAFFKYFSEDKLGNEYSLLFLAYYLDRETKMDFITKEGRLMLSECLFKFGAQYNLSEHVIGEVTKELIEFTSQMGDFGSEPIEGAPEEWWHTMPNSSVLKPLAPRIVSLRSSSANVERVFSAIKLIQSPNRLGFAFRTLENIAKVRIADFEALPSADDIVYEGMCEHERSPTPERNRHSSPSSLPRRQSSPASQRDRQSGPFSVFGNVFSRRSSCSQSSAAITPFSPTPESGNNHRPYKFTHAKLRKGYKRFVAVVDFNIVNTYSHLPSNAPSSRDNANMVRENLQKIMDAF